ncbi:MAG: hypothetical protein QOH06_295 [Acidobacteriota bacterium]|jgi:hypothetical protein|nr:hypothetical protein [Acidobacteriota bacterium]
MDDSRDSHPDFLREVLTPRPEAVERVVRNALSTETAKAAPWRMPLAAALLSGVALLFAWQLERARFEPVPAAISIVNEGGVVIATSPSGDWLIHSGGDPEPERSGIIIFSYGDQK